MKSPTPHDPLDELIAAALHGDLSPEERAQFDSRLENDPAARAAYQEAQVMHELLNTTHQSAQPDAAFEQRMVSGVRRKIKEEDQPKESAWGSVLVVCEAIRGLVRRTASTGRPHRSRSYITEVVVVLGLIAILAGVALGPITRGIKKTRQPTAVFSAITNQLSYASARGGRADEFAATRLPEKELSPMQNMKEGIRARGIADAKSSTTVQVPAVTAASRGNIYNGGTTVNGGTLTNHAMSGEQKKRLVSNKAVALASGGSLSIDSTSAQAKTESSVSGKAASEMAAADGLASDSAKAKQEWANTPLPSKPSEGNAQVAQLKQDMRSVPTAPVTPQTSAVEEATPDPSRKLIRNAQLDLEVKSYQAALDDITKYTRAAGGYVDTSNSRKGGNGKLQGTVVVKVMPQKLESFLFQLRDLGTIANQSVSTEDVTKDYYDTEARLANSRKMEAQLQELLKRTNGKVSELLQVEHELGRVRGEIEQMQGSLKYIDFQVQYATVTIALKEKDLNQAAAYLLKEHDNFSLFATDVESTFQKARAVADDFKAQVLQANLNHVSGNNVSAELVLMVAPGDIESFLTRIRDLGRVANFTRQTERVAQDGGESDRPADQTLTEKDKVEVHLSIRSDDEMRKQVALTVVTPTVDTALDAAKKVALEQPGTAILASSLNRTPEGQATARLTVRVPGVAYPVLIEALGKLGRTASLSIQRNDNAGPGSNGDEAPVIVSLSLTDEEAPLQLTEISVLASAVDATAQQLKKEALAAGVEVKASNFARQADGTETAQLVFRLPMGKNGAFLETLKKVGKVESLTVERSDQLRADDTAPAAIVLRLHNQHEIVPDNNGLWATLSQTFGEGAGALFACIKVIGVVVAFLAPWAMALGLATWVGRRIYLWRKGKK